MDSKLPEEKARLFEFIFILSRCVTPWIMGWWRITRDTPYMMFYPNYES